MVIHRDSTTKADKLKAAPGKADYFDLNIWL